MHLLPSPQRTPPTWVIVCVGPARLRVRRPAAWPLGELIEALAERALFVSRVDGFGGADVRVTAQVLDQWQQFRREVRLNCTRTELAHTEFFTETEIVPLDAAAAWYMADDTLPWPLVYPRSGMLLTERERVPDGQVAVDRETPVQARDGQVGRLQAVVVESNDDRMADVILRYGHMWRQRDVVIPAAAIERIDSDAVHLTVSKARIQALPTPPPRTAA